MEIGVIKTKHNNTDFWEKASLGLGLCGRHISLQVLIILVYCWSLASK